MSGRRALLPLVLVMAGCSSTGMPPPSPTGPAPRDGVSRAIHAILVLGPGARPDPGAR